MILITLLHQALFFFFLQNIFSCAVIIIKVNPVPASCHLLGCIVLPYHFKKEMAFIFRS